jgi:Flp pilus assembly pilin Flp
MNTPLLWALVMALIVLSLLFAGVYLDTKRGQWFARGHELRYRWVRRANHERENWKQKHEGLTLEMRTLEKENARLKATIKDLERQNEQMAYSVAEARRNLDRERKAWQEREQVWRKESGQGLVEYMLIVVGIALALVFLAWLLGWQVDEMYTRFVEAVPWQ